MKIHVLLAAAAAALLGACAGPAETIAERPALKCDVAEAGTGSRLTRREHCVPDTTKRQ